MYSSCANSTCRLTFTRGGVLGEDVQITAVRSTTLTLAASSNARRCDGGRSSSTIIVSVFLTRHDVGNLLGFAGTNVRGCIRLGAMLQQTIAYHRTGGFGERRQLSQ